MGKFKNWWRKVTSKKIEPSAFNEYVERSEEKFVAWAKTASDAELSDFIDMLPKSDDRRISFRKNMWGHAYRPDEDKIGKYIWHGHCFHGQIIGGPSIRVGQDILVQVEAKGGERTAVHKILFRKNVRDPKDMYWIYTIGIGYEE